MNIEQEVAKAILQIGAVKFNASEPWTYKSGIKSPVYTDNRIFPFWPEAWQVVISGFKQLIEEKKIDFDVIAGIESAGIPHSAALGFAMRKPSVFVRKEAKDHGTKKRVEGGEVNGKKVLLLEDLVSTGMSSLSGVRALRAEGAEVNDCIVIISYGMKEAEEAFAAENVRLHTLTSFATVLDEAVAAGMFGSKERAIIDDWLHDPQGWAERQGYGN